LLFVERNAGIDGLHASIVRGGGSLRNRRNPLNRGWETP
jgi:hypothetical protein